MRLRFGKWNNLDTRAGNMLRPAKCYGADNRVVVGLNNLVLNEKISRSLLKISDIALATILALLEQVLENNRTLDRGWPLRLK